MFFQSNFKLSTLLHPSLSLLHKNHSPPIFFFSLSSSFIISSKHSSSSCNNPPEFPLRDISLLLHPVPLDIFTFQKMEIGWSCEHNTLISELLQGTELAKQLRIELHSTSSNERRELLAARILSSFEKALLILKWREPVHPPRTASASPSLPGSAAASPDSNGFDSGLQDLKAPSKKRKMVPLLTGKVRVSSETGLEGPQEDGFSWRKYGQKDILGAKYPRSYYRCSFRNAQNCLAVKQVQRSDEDPSVFEISYRGNHACSHGTLSVPEEEEDGRNIHSDQSRDQNTGVDNTDALESRANSSPLCFSTTSSKNIHNQQLQSQDHIKLWIKNTDASVRKDKTTSIGCMESKIQHFSPSTLGNHPSLGSFSHSVLSPATPESNSYFPSPGQSSNFGGIHNMVYSESDIAEIFSAKTCATNSPVPSLNSSVDLGKMDPSFVFDTLEFFS